MYCGAGEAPESPLALAVPGLSYVVTATFSDRALVQTYIDWLQSGHTDAVRAGGALSAEILVLDANPPRVQTRYVFPDRPAFVAYESDHAPRLRQDGLRLFGPPTGTTFSRETGLIL